MHYPKIGGFKMSNYKLLNVDSNAKTVKGQKEGFLTGVLYLAPYKLSGFNTCAMAEIAQCAHACLNTAGRAGIIKTGESTNPIQQARIRKTKQFYTERNAFMLTLVKDIEKLIKQAKRDGFIPLVRLNGTSDINYDNNNNNKIIVEGFGSMSKEAVYPAGDKQISDWYQNQYIEQNDTNQKNKITQREQKINVF